LKQSAVDIQRWSHNKTPDEATIRQIYADEGLHPYRWSNGPGDVYGSHSHEYHKVIYVVQGSITFGLTKTGDQVNLRAGDRLDLPPGVVHDALVGSDGVVFLEAHR
jgi:quercetin dioxygenase-like cupin family protein